MFCMSTAHTKLGRRSAYSRSIAASQQLIKVRMEARDLKLPDGKEGKEESAGTIPEVHLLGQQLRPKQLRSEGNVSAGSSYRALASSGRRERVQRKLSPIKVENLVNLPVKPVTAEVIHSVAEILGYTELHPEVVEKIVDISIRVDAPIVQT